MAALTSCFLVLLEGQRFFVPRNHLFTCLHEKSWRSVDSGNQRVYFWESVWVWGRKGKICIREFVCWSFILVFLYLLQIKCVGKV